MLILEKLKQHRTTSAAETLERDRDLLARYRTLLAKSDPDDADVAMLDELVNRLRLDPGDVEADQTALARAAALHTQAANTITRWREIEKELGEIQIGQLRLQDPAERALASERQQALQTEQAELIRSTTAAAAEVTQLRQDRHRIAQAIEPIPPNVIPKSMASANPLLLAMLGAATHLWGNPATQAKYLRFRGVKMLQVGWEDAETGVVPLGVAFKKQLERDLAAAKDLLPLLASESGFH